MILSTHCHRLVLTALLVGACQALVAEAATDAPLPAEVRLKPGFRLDMVYRVPASQGSWVCLTSDRRGRLVASDEGGALYLITPSPIREASSEARVVVLPLDIGEAQGLACVGDDLYVVVNGSSNRWVSGLHRARDADGDGLWDACELLQELNAGGEHGPHAVIADAGGKSLLVCGGNHTDPPPFQSSRVPRIGPEDVLLAHLTSPTAFQAMRRPPPGGWIARCDLEGKHWELVSCGYRNQYDLALSRAGELFTYDSDMEYDIGMPWYRPTRVCHATSGSEYGWRSNSGPFPVYYPDTLPPVAELGPGSPTGLVFGYETNFPAPYRDALLAADWGRGVIHALQLEPSGASYTAKGDTLVQATPLPVTDMVANSVDGALYFATGGRGIESAIYRLAYVGDEPTRPELSIGEADGASAVRHLRRRLEALHRRDSEALAAAWPMLDHSDRFIRHAARIAVEHQPASEWRQKALNESVAGRRIAACMALVRADPAFEQSSVVNALSSLEWATLETTQQRECLRTYEILMARHGPLWGEQAARLRDQLLIHFPNEDASTTRLMASVLTRLGNPVITPRIVGHFANAWNVDDRIHLAHALCDVNDGWTTELRQTYFDHLTALIKRHRNSTLRPYLDQIVSRALSLAPEESRPALARQIAAAGVADATATGELRPFVRHWTVDQAAEALDRSTRSPALARGERLFAEATCVNCHRLKGSGGAVGPDLSTVAGRFTLRDLCTAIVDPDRVVSDQYQQTAFEVGGRVLVGRIVDQRGSQVRIATDMTDPKRGEYVLLEEIDGQTPSEISPMPRGLVDTLTAEELVDLVEFLRAGQ